MRNLSVPPPPETCPSMAVNRNPYVPAPLIVPVPFAYFDTNPNVAFPAAEVFGVYAPAGELIQPPPVTKPPLASYTASTSLQTDDWFCAASVARTQTPYTPAGRLSAAVTFTAGL